MTSIYLLSLRTYFNVQIIKSIVKQRECRFVPFFSRSPAFFFSCQFEQLFHLVAWISFWWHSLSHQTGSSADQSLEQFFMNAHKHWTAISHLCGKYRIINIRVKILVHMGTSDLAFFNRISEFQKIWKKIFACCQLFIPPTCKKSCSNCIFWATQKWQTSRSEYVYFDGDMPTEVCPEEGNIQEESRKDPCWPRNGGLHIRRLEASRPKRVVVETKARPSRPNRWLEDPTNHS
jgi:hypothetical protein